ncbi:3-oxoacyl-[acyl-carrier-protein] synthase III C-terminal domain-containing protein [Galbitalea sp. SE-J8]|uniref:type III polyketide synthase n=1 Tax=Galbitalea sp. SE-J8 TaxID=3054952 RepID=UPI00259CB7C6|nr:3-oxoacyl-[acyl-carrier-protein] synthase III C-terminal domain-containing protein [Galbitalea sp. SE-J8]MDM4763299.1 3-oxoacyl-[acyl-carrier-protein] synthase III C-terminal domain-containing protein [Galbitalea sp. SE-J8]
MTRIAAVAPVLPAHVYPQAAITAELAPLLTRDPGRRAVMERLHSSSRIAHRHTALPLEAYRSLGSFREANDAFIRIATDLLEGALRTALTDAALAPADIDALFFTSVTGIAAPSVDALLATRMGMRPDVKRTPSFGLGCVAGAAGLARVADYLDGHPAEVAVLLSAELCSLTLQRDDGTTGNLVATGLFGDGATAVVLVGDAHPAARGPRIEATRSALYPHTDDILGWRVGGTGFEIVLTSAVASVVDAHLPADAAAFLAAHGLTAAGVDHWVAHPGGPRVLEALAAAFGVPDAALQRSWDSLEAVGNLSSSSVLHVLADTIELDRPAPGAVGVIAALGPGLSAEFVLMRWP